MGHSRLIFVEGMLGSNSALVALELEQAIKKLGRSAHAYLEVDHDNPIRTRSSDQMLVKAPAVPNPRTGQLLSPRPLPSGLNNDGSGVSSAVYEIEQWAQLAQQCVSSPNTAIVENRYWQHSLLPHVLEGFPRYEINTAFDAMQTRLAALQPLVLYLKVSDPRAAAEQWWQRHATSLGPWWVRQIEASVWGRSRRGTGVERVAQLNEAYAELAERLLERHNGPKIQLNDVHLNWNSAKQQLASAVREI